MIKKLNVKFCIKSNFVKYFDYLVLRFTFFLNDLKIDFYVIHTTNIGISDIKSADGKAALAI
jgi:hypothetical protein